MSTGGSAGGGGGGMWAGISNLQFFGAGASGAGGGNASSVGAASSQLLSGISRLLADVKSSIGSNLQLVQTNC